MQVGFYIPLTRIWVGISSEIDTDITTGVLNKAALVRALKKAKHSNRDVGLIFIDVDNFKEMNSHLTHQGGDRMLNIIGERCKQAIKRGDVIGRFGGDEFVIILNNVTIEEARAVNQRLRMQFVQPIVINIRSDFKEAVSPMALSITSSVRLMSKKTSCSDDLFELSNDVLRQKEQRDDSSRLADILMRDRKQE